MTDPARERRLGWAAALGVLVIWVGFQLVGRVAAKQDLTPWDVGALRYAGAFLVALPIALRLGLPRMPPLRFAAILATAGFGFPLFAYLGFARAPASHAALITAAGLPVATALLARIALGEGLTARRAVSLGAIVGGVLLLAQDGMASPPGTWVGDVFFVAAVFSWAAYTLLLRRWGLPALGATLGIALGGAPLFLPLWWLALPSNLGAVPAAEALFQMAYHGAVASVLAGFLYNTAVAKLGPGPPTLVGALVPGLVALIAWPLLAEPLGWPGMAGVALAMAGMAAGVVRAR